MFFVNSLHNLINNKSKTSFINDYLGDVVIALSNCVKYDSMTLIFGTSRHGNGTTNGT